MCKCKNISGTLPQCSTQLQAVHLVLGNSVIKVFLKLTHNVQNDDQLIPFIADSLDTWSHMDSNDIYRKTGALPARPQKENKRSCFILLKIHKRKEGCLLYTSRCV